VVDPGLLVVVVAVDASAVLMLGDDEEVVGVVVKELDDIPVKLAVSAGLVEAWV
jgi:hypothetical protein